MEAPAGSGKTGLLIQRLLKLLAEAEITSPGEILAITFTRKAAGELRTRVLEQIERAAKGTPLAPDSGSFEQATRTLAERVLRRDRAQGWHLLASPHQLNIRTIDSFCGELARGMPLLAGGLGQRRPLDDASQLYEEAAGKVLRELGGPDTALNGALRNLLLHRDGRVSDCIELIAGMLAAREQWGELIPMAASQLTDEHLDGQLRHRLDSTLETIVSQGLAHTRQHLPDGWLDALAGFAARMSTQPGFGSSPSPLALCAGRPLAPGDKGADYDHWIALLSLVLTNDGKPRARFTSRDLKFELPPEARPQLQQLVEDLRAADERGSGALEALCCVRNLPPASLPEDQWKILKAAFHVLRRALAELEILFAQRGVCDFTALALTARQLMGSERATEPEPAAETPRSVLNLQHLLIDEMQDTSAGQYHLFELLTQTWDGASQTIFLVGDPKQSIYAFRQARVERFLRTSHSGRFGEVPLSPLYLTANFRSQAELVECFNETFAAILAPLNPPASAESAALQAIAVPFIEAVPVRPPGASPALQWHVRGLDSDTQKGVSPFLEHGSSLSPDPESPEDEAKAIRRTIESFLARWPAGRPPRVAVLARSRRHLAPVIAEFQQQRAGKQLPFRAVDVDLLNERPEVLDLLALTRALLHPGDRVAWLAVLRSPVCGLSLADLLALTGEGNDADTAATVTHLVDTRHHLLSPTGQERLGRVWPTLAHAQATLGQTSLSTQVERTWRSLGADAILDANALANARRYLHLLHSIERENESLHLGVLERRVRTLYAESASPDAVVELMTIHKSKGLEWDLVLIPALERGSGRNAGEMLRWFELDQPSGDLAPFVLAPLPGKGQDSSRLWSWLGRLQTEREQAEAKRLFYVACTRAREELHLYASVSLTAAGELKQPNPGSLLRAAWAAALPQFQQVRAEARMGSPSAENASLPSPWSRTTESQGEGLTLALAAAAEPVASQPAPPASVLPPVTRIAADFNPLLRFRADAGPRLRYPPAASLRHAAPLQRPTGSFAARAFGNVVHRFLESLTRKLDSGFSASDLLHQLPQWMPRLQNAFRGEGLAPAVCGHEAGRALGALQATLLDPVGCWLLSPHEAAWSERTIQVDTAVTNSPEAPPSSLRADRVFLAAAEPLGPDLSPGPGQHLWIVDFKTADQGGRAREIFFHDERTKYLPQLENYARASLALGNPAHPVILALYYPLLTHLVYWPFHPQAASDAM